MRALGLVLIVGGACAGPAPVVDTYAWSLPAGMPTPRVPADNPMTADKVELGRHLFYDTRLSRDGSQSCASCHHQARAFTDGRTTPLGITGEAGRHNAMSLVNVAYNASSTWASHVVRLEDQAELPMFGTHPVELGLAGFEGELLARLADEPLYADVFAREFPDAITIDNITRAVAAFERTIISGRTRFDRFVLGESNALDAREQRGLALFESERLGCRNCHGGFNLASAYDHVDMPGGAQVQFFNTGLYNVDGTGAYPAGDQGLIEVTGDARDMGRFRAPTLRNIAVTAPYFHDGSAATLDAVIDHYARGGVASPLKSSFMTGFTLTIEERADLLAFLGTLTDEALLADAAFASPW
jgi:cytochrome c peroxidase